MIPLGRYGGYAWSGTIAVLASVNIADGVGPATYRGSPAMFTTTRQIPSFDAA